MAKLSIDRGTLRAQHPQMSDEQIEAMAKRLETGVEIRKAHDALAAIDVSGWPDTQRDLWTRTLKTQRAIITQAAGVRRD